MPVVGAPIMGGNVDARMAHQTGFNSCRLAIQQEIDDTATLEVADDGAIALISLPREVVDPDDRG